MKFDMALLTLNTPLSEKPWRSSPPHTKIVLGKQTTLSVLAPHSFQPPLLPLKSVPFVFPALALY